MDPPWIGNIPCFYLLNYASNVLMCYELDPLKFHTPNMLMCYAPYLKMCYEPYVQMCSAMKLTDVSLIMCTTIWM